MQAPPSTTSNSTPTSFETLEKEFNGRLQQVRETFVRLSSERDEMILELARLQGEERMLTGTLAYLKDLRTQKEKAEEKQKKKEEK